jgi:hypothetical protein
MALRTLASSFTALAFRHSGLLGDKFLRNYQKRIASDSSGKLNGEIKETEADTVP